jgi:hypothetical protein
MRKIKNQYLKDIICMEEACSKLMEQFDLFRGEALQYLMK